MMLGLSLGIAAQNRRALIPSAGGVASFAGLDFTQGIAQSWGGLDFAAGYSRSGPATMGVDASGNIISVAANVPRFVPTSGGLTTLMLNSVRTRLNQEAVSAHSVTVTAQSYAISFYGTGSVILSGSHSATVVGDGANIRKVLVFTPTAGSLTLTPSGDVRYWQLEVSNLAAPSPAIATAYIVGAGANVTRVQDLANIALPAAVQTKMANGFWVVAQGVQMTGRNGPFNRFFIFDNGVANNRGQVNLNAGIGAGAIVALQQTVAGGTGAEYFQERSMTARFNLAVRFRLNDFAVIWPDGTVQTDNICDYVVPTLLRLSHNLSGADQPPEIFFEKIYCFDGSVSVASIAAHRSALP